MSDERQPDHMRPIPDGGLKDAMPGWLKRPPAWRNMPSAEERHERTLPEPDTSEIDPHSLLNVGDLPQWLQAIAERGEIPVPQPDAAVSHAVEQVQAASSHPVREELKAPEEEVPSEPTVSIEDSDADVAEPTAGTPITEPAEMPTPTAPVEVNASG